VVELAIHMGLKIPRPHGHAGSSPASGTTMIKISAERYSNTTVSLPTIHWNSHEELKKYILPYLILINVDPWDNYMIPSYRFLTFDWNEGRNNYGTSWWNIKYEKWIHHYNAYIAPDATGVLESNRFYVES
jgi:hypothetical protein